MTAERTKILEMLAEGKVSVADAERLLGKLIGSDEEPPEGHDDGATRRDAPPLKHLRVVVDGADGDKVNLRVPIGLLRTGIKLSTMLPTEAGEKLAESGVDLSHLSSLAGDDLVEALRELKVEVDSGDGDTVRIFCE